MAPGTQEAHEPVVDGWIATVGGTCMQLEEREIPGSGLRAFPNLASLAEHPL